MGNTVSGLTWLKPSSATESCVTLDRLFNFPEPLFLHL